MSLILKQIFALIKLLNSETGTNQISFGVACGLILGFSPLLSLQTLLVVILLLVFRIQIGAATVTAFFFSFIAWLVDPLCHALGTTILESPSLLPLFQTLYNMPIVPLTRFNNSIVMGSGALSLILFFPVYFFSRAAIAKYRETVVARFKETKFWKVIKATAFYKWYAKYEELTGS